MKPKPAANLALVAVLAFLLALFFLVRKQSSDRGITESHTSIVALPRSAPPEQAPTNSQLASAAASAALRSSTSEPVGPAATPASAAQSSGRLERTSPRSSCSRKALGLSTEPQSSAELSALVSFYLGCPTLRSALDEIYQQEARDEGWATKLEEKIEQTAAAQGVQVKGVCHTSLCRIDPDTSQPGECVRFNHALVNSVSGTELQGDILYWPTPTSCSRYFYSTVLPPAFLEPLLQRMEGGS